MEMYLTGGDERNTIAKQADISVLRIIATIAIVLLHTCSAMSDNYAAYSLAGTKLYILSSIALLLRWAVPAFFMISGAVLIKRDRNITYKDAFKYCKRILLALVLFGIMYSMMEIFMHEKTLSFQIFLQACSNVLTGNSWSFLCFLYSIIGIYLILPLINTFVSNAKTNTVVIFSILLFVFMFIVPAINLFFGIKIDFNIPVGSYAFLYFVIGKLLYETRADIKNRKLFFVIVLTVMSFLVLLINANGGKAYLGYDSPIIGGMAVCIFLLIKGIRFRVFDFMWKMDRLCFGVYLIHLLFINLLYKFMKITPLDFGKEYLLGVFLFWISFTTVSYCTSYFMGMVSPLKNMFCKRKKFRVEGLNSKFRIVGCKSDKKKDDWICNIGMEFGWSN